MSLINQMLRDLEERRKADSPQHDSSEVARRDAVRPAGGRWLWIILLGIVLGGVAWIGLKISSEPIDQQVVKTISTAPAKVDAGAVEFQSLPAVVPQESAESATVLVAEKTSVQAVAKETMSPDGSRSSVLVAKKQSSSVADAGRKAPATIAQPVVEAQRPAVVAGKKSAPSSVVTPAAKLNVTSTAGVKGASLTDIGLVEGIDSVRLMFEFEKMPAYRIRAVGQDATELTVSFVSTQKSNRLEIPPFRGPLLTLLELQAVKKDMQVSLGVGKPVKLQAYFLQADGVHGDRLLLVLSEDRTAISAASKRSQGTMGEKLRKQKVSTGTGSKEQAEVLYRKALRYLEQGNEGAAKIQFVKSLDLDPSNVELRLRLIEMLVKRQQLERAEDLMIAGLTLAPENPELRTHYGRLLLDHNQVGEALNLMLSKPIPSLPEQPDYHALLAALEQENSQFANAATRYRELLQIRPEQADWWLMLAISYEGLGDTKLAGSSYRQALEKAGLSTKHRQFALERLERLQRIGETE